MGVAVNYKPPSLLYLFIFSKKKTSERKENLRTWLNKETMLHLFPRVVVQEMFVADVSLASWTQGNVIESSQKKNLLLKQMFPSLATSEQTMFPQLVVSIFFLQFLKNVSGC